LKRKHGVGRRKRMRLLSKLWKFQQASFACWK
jgi:hypothetical protein